MASRFSLVPGIVAAVFLIVGLTVAFRFVIGGFVPIQPVDIIIIMAIATAFAFLSPALPIPSSFMYPIALAIIELIMSGGTLTITTQTFIIGLFNGFVFFIATRLLLKSHPGARSMIR